MRTATQSRALLSWLGGKSLLADTIIPLIPDHHCYVEAFAGGAWLLFKKPPSKVEVINDINLELVTLYRVVKHHPDEFKRQLKWALVARADFEMLLKADPTTLTDVQRAARFYYLTRAAYGADIVSPRFSGGKVRASNLNLNRVDDDLASAHRRLSRVFVENLSYVEVIRRYDGADTFFYLDPPYYGKEQFYGKGIFSRADFDTLAELLSKMKGKFILSLNDVPDVRRIVSGFVLREITTRYRIGNAARDPARRELLILNFEPANAVFGSARM